MVWNQSSLKSYDKPASGKVFKRIRNEIEFKAVRDDAKKKKQSG